MAKKAKVQVTPVTLDTLEAAMVAIEAAQDASGAPNPVAQVLVLGATLERGLPVEQVDVDAAAADMVKDHTGATDQMLEVLGVTVERGLPVDGVPADIGALVELGTVSPVEPTTAELAAAAKQRMLAAQARQAVQAPKPKTPLVDAMAAVVRSAPASNGWPVGAIPGTNAPARAANGTLTAQLNVSTVGRGLVYAGWGNAAIYTFLADHYPTPGLKPSYPAWYRSTLSVMARQGKLAVDLPAEYQTTATSRQGSTGAVRQYQDGGASTLESQALRLAQQTETLAAQAAQVAQQVAALEQAHVAYCAALGVAVDQASPVSARLAQTVAQQVALGTQHAQAEAESNALNAALVAFAAAMAPAVSASTVEA